MNLLTLIDSIEKDMTFYDDVVSRDFDQEVDDPNKEFKTAMKRELLSVQSEAVSEDINWEVAKLMFSIYAKSQILGEHNLNLIVETLITSKPNLRHLLLRINYKFFENIASISKRYQQLYNLA